MHGKDYPLAVLDGLRQSRRAIAARAGDFSVTKEDFTDEMVSDFATMYRGMWSIDELLLHPRKAVRFCDEVRHQRGYYNVPDDVILRLILTRRKNPAG